ncbi:Pathogenesis-related protein 1 [Bienertia sinuspersici]
MTTISNLCVAIFLLSVVSVTQICWATLLAPAFPVPDDTLQWLVPHNIARQQTFTGEPPLVWNETVAEFARKYAQERSVDCKLVHSHVQGLGENLAMSTRDLSPTKAVEMWVGEKPDYDVANNNCKKMCGHYTQVVWTGTRSVGCAKVRCQNGGTFIGCNYYPPGNVIGFRPF